MDDLVLVGAATKMPCVQKCLSKLTGVPYRKAVDPDRAVAFGAALQARANDGEIAAEDDFVVVGAFQAEVLRHFAQANCCWMMRTSGREDDLDGDLEAYLEDLDEVDDEEFERLLALAEEEEEFVDIDDDEFDKMVWRPLGLHLRGGRPQVRHFVGRSYAPLPRAAGTSTSTVTGCKLLQPEQGDRRRPSRRRSGPGRPRSRRANGDPSRRSSNPWRLPRPTGRNMPTSWTATFTALGTKEGALPFAASWRAARCAAFAAFSARLRSPRVATSCAAGEASKSDASWRAASGKPSFHRSSSFKASTRHRAASPSKSCSAFLSSASKASASALPALA